MYEAYSSKDPVGLLPTLRHFTRNDETSRIYIVGIQSSALGVFHQTNILIWL